VLSIDAGWEILAARRRSGNGRRGGWLPVVLSPIRKHDTRVTGYKIALLRAINDVAGQIAPRACRGAFVLRRL
jgi:hypothetical protein